MKKEFGSGHLDLDKIDLRYTSRISQAEHFGYRLGCSIVPSVIKREGAEFAARRYFQLVLYYGYVAEEIKKLRPDLLSQISSPIKRLDGEPLASFDSAWAPKEVYTTIPGPETVAGYALPRLITYYSHESKIEKPSERMFRGLDYFTRTLAELEPSDDINSLVLKYAEKLATAGIADKKQILRNTISAGKLKQDSFHTYFGAMVAKMKTCAPTLWETYSKMNPNQREQYKIADVNL